METHAIPREDRRVWVPPRLRVHHRRFLSMVASEANHRKLLIMKEQTGKPTKLCWRAQKIVANRACVSVMVLIF